MIIVMIVTFGNHKIDSSEEILDEIKLKLFQASLNSSDIS